MSSASARRTAQVILNITTGPGGRFAPDPDDPKVAGPGTTLMRPENRVAHIALLKPDICTLDLNTMNSGKEVVINTPPNVRRMAAVIREARVRPEIELFDSGDIALCRDLIADGTLEGPILCSIVMGVKYGFQPSPETVLYARGLLPPGTVWTAFGTGRIGLSDGGAVLSGRRACPRRAGGRRLSGEGRARAVQRRDGREGAQHRRIARRTDRDRTAGARNAVAAE